MSQAKPPATSALLIDLGPILVFVVAFNMLQRLAATKDNAVYIATGLFIAATLAAMAYCKLKRGSIPPVLIVTGVFVTAFGGLTILLREPTLIQIKVTAVNAFYAVAILVSLAIRQNVWKLLFGHLYILPDRIWNVMALRWAGFFGFMAALNEVLRAQLSFDAWVALRPMPLALIFGFALLNASLLMKHASEPAAAPPAPGG